MSLGQNTHPDILIPRIDGNGQIRSESHSLSNIVHRLKIVVSSHIVLKHREA